MKSESDLDDGIKTHCIYAAVVDAGQIYTDQMGIFPVISSTLNVSMMVLYEYDGNVTIAEPIKNNKSAKLLRSFQVMEQKNDIQRTQTQTDDIGQLGINISQGLFTLPRHKLSVSTTVFPSKVCRITCNSLV
jgi:hypothetical protein